MPYNPDAVTSDAFRATNQLLNPAPSLDNVLFDNVVLATDRPIAYYLSIANACAARVLNMQRAGYTKVAWRNALLAMLLGYYQWPQADPQGFYAITSQ